MFISLNVFGFGTFYIDFFKNIEDTKIMSYNVICDQFKPSFDFVYKDFESLKKEIEAYLIFS